MNILIYGKNGQLGRAFQNYFQNSDFDKCNNIFLLVEMNAILEMQKIIY